MQPVIDHPWQLPESEAVALQARLAALVCQQDCFGTVGLVAGVDVAYAKEGTRLIAVAVVLAAGNLQPVETVLSEDETHFPYQPGLLSFRELPPIVKCLTQLRHAPDLIMCDGQGLAHPRRFGLACHLGVIFDKPVIGCAKTRLVGVHAEPAPERGSCALLIHRSEIVGCVLRTQTDAKPVFVSVGHRISLDTACEWTLRLSPKFRLPEVIRHADHAVRMALKRPRPTALF